MPATDIVSRLWRKDASLWTNDADTHSLIAERLGWLDVLRWAEEHVDGLVKWKEVFLDPERFKHVVVLGMGGSSLAPLVFSELFTKDDQHPDLLILDSTSPEMVSQVLQLELSQCLFIVSSKSGSTLETMDLYRFFYDQVAGLTQSPQQQFIAVTDPGSWLETHATKSGFAKVFLNPPDIGGRYSALSYFGLVPAVLYGVDIDQMLDHTKTMVARCKDPDETKNPGLQLGQLMGEHGNQGLDKMRVGVSIDNMAVGFWIEQLVAESTGKEGKGILPNVMASNAGAIKKCIGAEEYIIEVTEIDDPYQIGALFFKWEFATAVSAYYLGVNPFDEPNVAEAKASTQAFISKEKRFVSQMGEDTEYYRIEYSVVSDTSNTLQRRQRHYIGLLGYLPILDDTEEGLQLVREVVAERYQVPCTIGFGPRYLHSTGQLHKGGPKNGGFIQFVAGSSMDFSVPDRDYTFAELHRAQADGDFSVLAEKNLAVMRVVLKKNRLESLQRFAKDLAAGEVDFG